jgi:hypothetical protein
VKKDSEKLAPIREDTWAIVACARALECKRLASTAGAPAGIE